MIKLYNTSSYIFDFEATVISCTESNGVFVTLLDKTAFFPESGGQKGDIGLIGETEIFDTREDNGVVLHYSHTPTDVGKVLRCSVNREVRFARMQNHTGEHIMSGIIHKKYGYENVGFHLGDDYMTFDTDGVLNDAQISEIEYLANRAVWDNLKISISYPSDDILSNIFYRSKLELTENVRLVEIEGIDVCACCAPHVSRTGEVGIIKVIDFMRYKGGMRIFAVCGDYAFRDYSSRVRTMKSIAREMSLSDDAIEVGFRRLKDEISSLNGKISALREKVTAGIIASLSETDKSICIFEKLETKEMRDIVNVGMKKAGEVCAVFSGDDENGYKYVIGSLTKDLRTYAKELNSALCGHGGGSSQMIQGSVGTSRYSIEKFFS